MVAPVGDSSEATAVPVRRRITRRGLSFAVLLAEEGAQRVDRASDGRREGRVPGSAVSNLDACADPHQTQKADPHQR
eukprot:8632355-Heterocapsa_arctica.AAC.1